MEREGEEAGFMDRLRIGLDYGLLKWALVMDCLEWAFDYERVGP